MNTIELAEIHGASFSYAPRAWSAAEIESVLRSPNCKLIEQPSGFAIFRIVGPEAELLTIAVHPDFRRQGIAQNLIHQGHKIAKTAGVQEVFLEVSEENLGAQALYIQNGYKNKAIRESYYSGPNGQKINGLVMSCALEN